MRRLAAGQKTMRQEQARRMRINDRRGQRLLIPGSEVADSTARVTKDSVVNGADSAQRITLGSGQPSMRAARNEERKKRTVPGRDGGREP